ncbi:hypothetical protein HZH66_013269 [Vespula vulgaris]|uniref:Uncharacterized protein n=1 Tax=Vespula vulgaris TaxID=7454 RepID=A0A834J7H7_VESVU|nr:hypothetical protein HZH66_013269 [Vespula vulgaris]
MENTRSKISTERKESRPSNEAAGVTATAKATATASNSNESNKAAIESMAHHAFLSPGASARIKFWIAWRPGPTGYYRQITLPGQIFSPAAAPAC